MQANQTKRSLIVIAITIFVGAILLIFNNKTTQSQFCSTEDNLYKTINSHAAEWDRYFFTSPQAFMNRFLDFSTEDGQKFTAIKFNNPHQFFVVTNYDYPHSYIGAKGYMFSPSGISNLWDEYKYTPIGTSVYCYQKQ